MAFHPELRRAAWAAILLVSCTPRDAGTDDDGAGASTGDDATATDHGPSTLEGDSAPPPTSEGTSSGAITGAGSESTAGHGDTSTGDDPSTSSDDSSSASSSSGVTGIGTGSGTGSGSDDATSSDDFGDTDAQSVTISGVVVAGTGPGGDGIGTLYVGATASIDCFDGTAPWSDVVANADLSEIGDTVPFSVLVAGDDLGEDMILQVFLDDDLDAVGQMPDAGDMALYPTGFREIAGCWPLGVLDGDVDDLVIELDHVVP